MKGSGVNRGVAASFNLSLLTPPFILRNSGGFQVELQYRVDWKYIQYTHTHIIGDTPATHPHLNRHFYCSFVQDTLSHTYTHFDIHRISPRESEIDSLYSLLYTVFKCWSTHIFPCGLWVFFCVRLYAHTQTFKRACCVLVLLCVCCKLFKFVQESKHFKVKCPLQIS